MEPAELTIPPGPDPLGAATESWYWGEEAYHIVPYEGQYYVWVRWPPPGDHVIAAPSQQAARRLLDREQAWFTFVTNYGNRLAHVELVEQQGGGVRLLYEAVLLDGGEAGFLVAVRDEAGAEEPYRLRRLDDPRAAGEEFAGSVEQFAGRVERDRLTGFPELAAANLRYRAAAARTDTLRIVLGDAVRREESRIRGERGLIPMVGRIVGVSREFLYRVLAGNEWARTTKPAASSAAQPRPAPAGPPAASWTVMARFSFDAAGEREARAALTTVLGTLDVPLAGEPSLTPAGGHDRRWIARADLDLSGLSTIDPDDALTRLRYVIRNVPGVTWRTEGRPREGRARFEWPDGWVTREQTLLDPAVRAAEITAAEDHPSA